MGNEKIIILGGFASILFIFFMCLIGILIIYLNKEEEDTTTTTTKSSPTTTTTTTTGRVTINGESFDSSGYTVSKGWFWNRKSLGRPSGTGWCNLPAPSTCNISVTDAGECRQKCESNIYCVSHGFEVGKNMCHLFETEGGGNNVHVRGIKKDGNNMYSKTGKLGTWTDSADTNERMDIGQCISRCNNDSNCHGWYYRTKDHNDDKYKRTCVTYRINTTDSDQYKEGVIDRA